MNAFDVNRSAWWCSSRLSETIVQLGVFLVCAVACCTIIGCSYGFFMHGRVVDVDGNPVAGAKLEFSAMNNEFISTVSLSGPDGTFTFEASTSSRVDRSVVSVSVERSGFAPVKMRLRLGNNYDDAEIVLVRLEEAK